MFDDEQLKGKFSNIFIKLLVGVSAKDLSKIKHYLSDNVYNKYQEIINNLNQNNEIECFDELNVKEISIVSKENDNEYEIVKVKLVARYMDYIIDEKTLEYKRGINDHRVEKEYQLIFKKKLEIANRPSVVKCSGCGANLDVNYSGVCNYCGTIHSAESYDYILIEVISI